MQTGKDPQKRPRRLGRAFLKTAAVLAIAGGACAGYGWFIEPTWVEVNRVETAIDGLPPAFDGFVIAHLSDIHHHGAVRLPYIEKCLNLVADLKPDMVAITGDFVSESSNHVFPLAERLAKLAKRCPTYAVLGNHDHWTDAETISGALRAAGVKVLVNDADMIERSGERLAILGVDDLWEGRPDLPQALSRANGAGTKVLLAHNPDYLKEVDSHGIALMLCGHTHGGQVTLPLVGPLIVHAKLGAKGLFKVGDTRMYVNKGIGLIRPAVRFLTRPEIAIIRLKRAVPGTEP
jgi:predicted MPP superfamily phosphohydrolase